MTYRLRITDDALADIDEILEWYFRQAPNQQQRCFEKIDQCLYEVQQHPTHYGNFPKGFRVAFADVFPYKLFFKITGDEVEVFGVFHLSRSDEAILRRLP